MAYTVEEIALAALGDLNEDSANVLHAARWVNERYAELQKRRLKHRRKVGELLIPAAITAGTASVTQGSSVVTGNATAIAAWTETVVGRYFKKATVWHRIQGYNAVDGTLILETPFTESTAAAASYVIVQRYAALDASAGFLGADFLLPRRYRKLTLGSLTELNLCAPSRQYSTSGPEFVCEFDEQDGTKRVEVYPYSTQDEQLLYVFWERPTPLGLHDLLPSVIEKVDLKAGVLVDAFRFKQATAKDVAEKQMWGNESRRQQSVWNAVQQDMVKRDNGVEDLQLMITSRFVRMPYSIETARDFVYARGMRP